LGVKFEAIKEQTPEICLVAVQQSGMTLEFTKYKTPDIYGSYEQYGCALTYVKMNSNFYLNIKHFFFILNEYPQWKAI
jgi:hypothetical protein